MVSTRNQPHFEDRGVSFELNLGELTRFGEVTAPWLPSPLTGSDVFSEQSDGLFFVTGKSTGEPW